MTEPNIRQQIYPEGSNNPMTIDSRTGAIDLPSLIGQILADVGVASGKYKQIRIASTYISTSQRIQLSRPRILSNNKNPFAKIRAYSLTQKSRVHLLCVRYGIPRFRAIA